MFPYYDDETFTELFLPFLSGGPLFNLLMINTLGCEIADLSSWLSKWLAKVIEKSKLGNSIETQSLNLCTSEYCDFSDGHADQKFIYLQKCFASANNTSAGRQQIMITLLQYLLITILLTKVQTLNKAAKLALDLGSTFFFNWSTFRSELAEFANQNTNATLLLNV